MHSDSLLQALLLTMDDADDLFGGLPSVTKAENASAMTAGAVSSVVVNNEKNDAAKKISDAHKPTAPPTAVDTAAASENDRYMPTYLVLLVDVGQVRQHMHAVDTAVRPKVQHHHLSPQVVQAQSQV